VPPIDRSEVVSRPLIVSRRTAVVAVLATALVTACAGGLPSGSPTGSGTASGNATRSASPSPSLTNAPLVGPSSTDGFMPTWIPGLQIVRDGSEDPDCAWSTSYPTVPGADALNTRLRDTVAGWMATAREGAAPPARCADGNGVDHVEIGFDFLAASADVVGVRLTIRNGNNVGSGISTDTLWFDGRTGKQSQAVSLLDPASLTTFSARVKALLSGTEGFDPQAAADSLSPQYLAGTVNDLAFSDNGDLHARFQESAVAVAPAGMVEIVIPRAAATPLLSDFGRRIQEQALHPTRHLTLPEGATTSGPAGPVTAATTTATAGAVDCRRVRCVALTFDDGPGPYTRQLLTTLARYDAKATFFVVGQNVVASPAIVRAEIAAGHEVGNHSWSHRDLSRLSRKDLTDQLTWDDQAIQNAAGSRPVLIRPPYGAISATLRSSVDRPLILWNVDTLDWKFRNSKHVTQAALAAVRPGSIVLMHDIHPTTVQAVPQILDALSRQGYHFVTVSQLEAGTSLQPGHVYSSGPTPR
jgi:peptidoglycan/xylan/chitin deacetylase (PgdA/CDA1 family)